MEPVYTEEQFGEQVENVEKKYRGLSKGATSILLILLMVALFQNPIYLSFLDKGLIFLKLAVVPESVFLIVILALVSIVTTLQGVYLSIRKFNVRGLLLSLVAVFFFIGLSIKGNDIYTSYAKMTKESKASITSFITIEDRKGYIVKK